MNIPSSILTMLAGVALTLASLWYGQNHHLLPVQATEEASLIDDLFNAMMVIGTWLFLLVQGIIVIAAFRFRRRPGDTSDGPPVHGNIPLEILWTAIPAVVVLGIGIYSFNVYSLEGGTDATSHMAHLHSKPNVVSATSNATTLVSNNGNLNVIPPGVGASPDRQGQAPEFVVNVTGLQYAWLFNYPDQNITSGELHLPLGKEVKLNISANDVIHAFWVPEFRLKQDAIPGRQASLRLTPSKVGEYGVICAELCGPYHSAMKTLVKVETLDDYDRWIQSQHKVAESDPQRSIASAPVAAPHEQALAYHAEKMGVDADVLQQIRSPHPHTAQHQS